MPTPHGSDSVEPGPGGTTVLVCRQAKEWVARKEATRLASEHPGTAVVWDDTLWEVLAAEGGGGGIRYRLAAWDERHTVRVRVAYDEASESRRALDARREGRHARARKILTAAAPLTGLLPGPVQGRWEKEMGVNASRLTIVSTISPFVVGTTSLILFLAAALGAAAPPGILVFLVWFFPESIFRFAVAMGQGIPVGSVPGHVAWFVWRGIRGQG